MTRYSNKARDEVPERDSDRARRRTKPADVGPASPKAIAKLYSDKDHPDLAQGDKRDLQAPQSDCDKRQKDYHNDVSKGWLRGEGEDGRGHGFDHGSLDPSSKPSKVASGGYKASGKNMEKSPFSAAHFKGKGER